MKQKTATMVASQLFRSLINGAACCSLLYSTSAQAAPTFKWARQFKTNSNGWGTNMTLDKSGNVYNIGNFKGTVDFDPGAGVTNLSAAGEEDAFITKMDPAGNLVWALRIGGTASENAHGITVDAAGNIYVAGIFKSPAMDVDPGAGTHTLTLSGTTDAFILKLDAAGKFVWARQLGGSTSECTPYAVSVDAAGNVYTAGSFSETADFDPGAATTNMTCKSAYYESFVSKLDAAGNYVWARQLEGDDFNGIAFMQVDGPGNVYAMGMFQDNMDADPGTGVSNMTTAGLVDVFVVKLDAAGNRKWSTKVGGTEPDWPRGLTLDPAGSVIITGTFDSKADFDPYGASFVMKSIGSSPGPDVFILKLDNAGKFTWARQLGAGGVGGVESTLGVATDAAGKIYLAGNFSGTMDMDPGPGSTYLVSSGSPDIFISVLNSSGDYYWAGALKGSAATSVGYANGIAVDAVGEQIYTTGNFYGKIKADPAGGSEIDEANGAAYVDKLAAGVSRIPGTQVSAMLQVYPNPCSEILQVVSAQPLQQATLRLSDMTGRTLMDFSELSGSYREIDMRGLPAGMYLLELHAGGTTLHTKVIRP